MIDPDAYGRLPPDQRLLVAEAGRTGLGLARALCGDELAQVAASKLIMSMPRKELEHVTSALASLVAGLVTGSGFGWDDVNAEMERRIVR